MVYDWPRGRLDRRPGRFPGTRTGSVSSRGRARAPYVPPRGRPPVSPRRQAQRLRPNLPVPPSVAGPRHLGEPMSTYASVTRRGAARGQGGPRPAARQYEPADPDLRKLIRQLYALLRMTHHLRNVAQTPGQPEPRMITRMVNMLSTMIKPAAPTDRTRDFIRGNALNWGHTTLLILQDHYTDAIDSLLAELELGLPLDWHRAFEIAVRWAIKNTPHISQETIDHVGAQITSCTNTHTHPDPTDFPPLDRDTQGAQSAQSRPRVHFERTGRRPSPTRAPAHTQIHFFTSASVPPPPRTQQSTQQSVAPYSHNGQNHHDRCNHHPHNNSHNQLFNYSLNQFHKHTYNDYRHTPRRSPHTPLGP